MYRVPVLARFSEEDLRHLQDQAPFNGSLESLQIILHPTHPVPADCILPQGVMEHRQVIYPIDKQFAGYATLINTRDVIKYAAGLTGARVLRLQFSPEYGLY